MSKLFATFDPTMLGPDLGLEQANTILLTTADGTDVSRAALCLYGKSTGQWFAEFGAWGPDDLTGVYVGVSKAGIDLERYFGRVSATFSLLLDNGSAGADIVNGAVVLTTVDPVSKGDIIGVWVNIGDGSAPTVSWFVNGILQDTQALPDEGPWYLGATTSGATAGGMKLWVNTGQRAFVYPVPGAPGWYEFPEAVPAILAATDDYITPDDDTLPNTIWDGTIADDGVEIVTELRFWVDGNGRSTQGSAVSVPLANDGSLDWLLTVDTRDLSAMLQTVNPGESYDNAQNLAVMIVDDIQVIDQNTVRVSLVSSMAELDQPLQRNLFPPSADPVVAGEPWPIVLGAVRQMTPVLVDPVNRIYALTDLGIVGIGYVRDKGAPLDPAAITPDYVIGTDHRTIVLETEPVGKLTADVSNIGGSVPPTLAEDIWLSYGNPFTNSAGVPAGFDALSHATYVSGKCVLTSPGLSGTAYIGLSTATCTTGRSYRYHVELTTVPGAHSFGTPTVSISTSVTGTPLVAWTAPGTYEGIITALYDFTPRLVLRDALTASTTLINKAYILEIPDAYDPAEIQPITLTDFVREVIEARAGRPASSWSLDDTSAIDAVGYAGIGFFDASAITIRNAIDSVMSSYGACAWVDENDVLRFTRLTDPELETPVGEITEDDLLTELTCKADLAPGLSTQMQFRKNWTAMNESDFVTDYVTVPGETRRALSQAYQGIVATAKPLAPMYAHAVYADPVGVLLDVKVDAQAEIDRLGDYYSVPRFFYGPFDVSDELGVKLGTIWTLKNSRYGLSAGKNVLVCKTIPRPIDGTVQITLRG